MPEGLAVESVEQRVAGTIGGGAAAVGLTTLAELLGLATEGTLVAGESVSPPMSCLLYLPNQDQTPTYIFPSSVLEKGQP